MPPKKEKGDAAPKTKFEPAEPFSDDISARRERGKLAQRAFRQRQIDMIRTLKDENARLKDSISNISASVHRGARELKHAIDEACHLAEVKSGASSHYMPSSPCYGDGDGGIPIQGSRLASEESLQNNVPMMDHGSYSWPGPHMDGREFMDAIVQPTLDGTQQSFEASKMMSYVSNSESSIGSLAQMPPMAVAEMQTLHIDEQMSPHLQSYTHGSGARSIAPGLNISYIDASLHPQARPVGNASLRSPSMGTPSTPPSDILPYIGARAYNNVAGRAFWQTLRYGWHILKTFEQSLPTPSTDVLGIIYNLFHVDATHSQSVVIIRDHIIYRLAFRDHTSSSSTTLMQHPSHAQNIQHYNDSQLQQNNRKYSTKEEDKASQSLAASFLSPESYPSLPSMTPRLPSISMESLMVESIKAAGLKPHSYLGPLAMDERLQQILGDAYHDLQAALDVEETISSPSSIDNPIYMQVHGSTLPHPYTSVAKLLHTLAKQAIFFPDGPRWHVDTVASAAAMWTTGRDDKLSSERWQADNDT